MEFGKCQRCGNWKWNPIACKCQLFLIWVSDEAIVGEKDKATLIYAETNKEAAEKAVIQWYQTNTSHHAPDSLDVWVKDGFDGATTAHTVVAEPRIEFVAHLK